jgi:hypothetical protein
MIRSGQTLGPRDNRDTEPTPFACAQGAVIVTCSSLKVHSVPRTRSLENIAAKAEQPACSGCEEDAARQLATVNENSLER